jgi:hypothetical protein
LTEVRIDCRQDRPSWESGANQLTEDGQPTGGHGSMSAMIDMVYMPKAYICEKDNQEQRRF